MRHVLLTFLGTGNYKDCRYQYGADYVSNPIAFVQEAISECLCAEWGSEDAIYVFLTEGAQDKHWSSLKAQIEGLNLPVQVHPVSIPRGLNEAQIWEIFSIVSDSIKPQDRVLIDITHSFRILPMMMLTLLNYLKVTKNITINDIVYGAFEAKDEQDIAPILSLKSFDTLLEWGTGAELFVNYGVVDKLVDVTPDEQDHQASSDVPNIGILKTSLQKMSTTFNTIRGYDIIEGQVFSTLNKQIRQLKAQCPPHSVYKPLVGVLQLIEGKISQFKVNSISNIVVAGDWLFKNGKTQQALTLLQEGIKSWLIKRTSKTESDYHRRLVSYAFHCQLKKIHPREEEDIPEEEHSDILDFIDEINRINQQISGHTLEKEMRIVSDFRNDLNHAGMNERKSKNKHTTDPNKESEILNKVKKSIDQFSQIYNTVEGQSEST